MLVIYDISSQEWYNVSASAISYWGTAVEGAAHFVPSFGPAGLLIVLGGRGAYLGDSQAYFALDNITINDPLSQQWAFQKATGDIPLPVQFPCVVGAEGDSGTYEVRSTFLLQSLLN